MIVSACSTQKNTAKSRWWHAFNARYNTYYNGKVAYIDGSLAKETGNKDNFTEMIPLYTVGNKQSRQLGSSQFDRAIEKSQKAIKQHSIKKRPEWNKSRKKTERDIEWLSRREYNPFLWKAWMLMGRSQFYKGNFEEAAATFSYMSRLYQTQPAIYGKARAWLAKCYIEMDWLYDAEDVIRNISRDSIDWRAQKEWDYTYTDYYLHTGEYEKAIPYLRKVIKHEMRKKQKAREWYLMGQLQSALGHKKEAYDAYRHVIRQSPPYETEFNARIAMTEVMAEGGQTRQVISKLKRMAASDKNKDYLDQVYYAMGNIYLTQHDTLNAIAAYEKGNEKGTRNGIEKGVLLLRLGDLYWAKEKFNDAQRCYGSAIGMLDRDRKDYKQLSERSKVLDELVPYTDAVHLQDSLQILANMDEASRNAAIDKVIEALIKKEKEEKRKQQEAEAEQVQQRNGGDQNRNLNQQRNKQPTTNAAPLGEKDGQWYFYNPLAVSQGKATFQKQWGKRENVDDWQRVNKTVVGGDFNMPDQAEMTQEMLDSISKVEAVQDSIDQAKEDPANNPHKREYYLAQIPFTEEQVAASNAIIKDGLHHSGVIFKDKLDNLRLSEKQLRRLTDFYPDYEQMDDVYYHLFLLYSRRGETAIANEYVELLRTKYPESQWTTVLTDPYFRENSLFGVQIEDSLYAATYEAFKADRYSEVAGNAHISETRFPLGANRDKFIFINGLSMLNNGNVNGCVEAMNDVVKNYPKSRISEMAGMIVNGVKAGRQLHGGKFDLGDVWSRRTAVLNDSDSLAARQFTDDRNADFIFMLAYSPDSLNENQLLYEMARFNFTNFIVRNFDLTIAGTDDLHQMQITGFRNFDEAHQYAQQVYANEGVVRRMNNQARAIIISRPNLELLGTLFSYDDYDEYYSKHFAPLKVNTRYLLSDPDGYADAPEPKLNPLPESIEKLSPVGLQKRELKEKPADDGTMVIDDGGKVIDNGGKIVDDGGTFIDDSGTNINNGGTVIDDGGTFIDDSGTNIDNGGTVIDDGGTFIDDSETVIDNGGTVIDDGGTVIDDEPITPNNDNRNPIEPKNPIDNIDDIELIDQTGSTEPTKPTRVRPNRPSQPVTPTPPTQPETPTPPTPPVTPPTPVEPTPPVTPVTPEQPTSPVTPQPSIEDDVYEIDDDGNDDDDDVDIIFDDFDTPSTPPQNNNNNNNNQQPQQGYDLEDEYYELDGF